MVHSQEFALHVHELLAPAAALADRPAVFLREDRGEDDATEVVEQPRDVRSRRVSRGPFRQEACRLGGRA